MGWSAVRCIPRELSLTSASTLATLERTGPRRITDLAAIEGVTQPAMTVLVRVMEESGLVGNHGAPHWAQVRAVRASRGTRYWASGLPHPVTGSQPGAAV